jgi:DNA-binding NarL/FixJ family response regulator
MAEALQHLLQTEFDVVGTVSDGRALIKAAAELKPELAEGHSMKEVAAVLDISPRTVEFHKYRVMELLGVKTNAELVQYAIKHGLIAPWNRWDGGAF